MSMFKIWLQGVQEDEHNPFMAFANDFINNSGSFSIEDFTFGEEEDEDDDA